MWACVVTALALAGAARAEQYAGGPPLYGAGDYEERAPDAPPALDYRDEEEGRRPPADYDYPEPAEEARARRRPRERVFAPPPPARAPRPAPRPAPPPDDEEGAGRRRADEAGGLADSDEADEWPPPRATRPPARPTRSTRPPPAPAAYPDYREYYERAEARSPPPAPPAPPAPPRWTPTAPRRQPAREWPTVPPEWSARRAAAPPAAPATTAPPAPPTAPAAPSGTAAPYSPVAFVPEVNSSAPSLAERSRLSILRKAQRKEGAGGAASKPPVLLLVTSRAPTVVMVEAPGRPPLDSPDTLAKVKRLMRRKLVAGARSVADLADGWDDVVCEYVDPALLDGGPARGAPRAALLLALAAARL